MDRADTAVILDAVIRDRRTNPRIDLDRAVDDDLIGWLCELATWAPNHKRTEPWRFAVVRGDARRHLGELMAEFLRDTGRGDAELQAGAVVKYERAPVVVVIASESDADADAMRRDEDRDAVAAGVQNLLLGATAAGLASYWGSGPLMFAPAVKRWCGFADHAVIVAVVYLGWPDGIAAVPQRRRPQISYPQ